MSDNALVASDNPVLPSDGLMETRGRGFRDLSESERINMANKSLVGHHISIFWDGDSVFYPCTVKSYDENSGKHMVLYLNDESGELYDEDLRNSKWRLWEGTEEDFARFGVHDGSHSSDTSRANKASKKVNPVRVC